MKSVRLILALAAAAACVAAGAEKTQYMPPEAVATPSAGAADSGETGYLLGPGDQITIKVTDLEEINDKPVQIDTDGFVSLPMAGRVQAAGRSAVEFQDELRERLKRYLVQPDVSVSVATFRSQPVSIVGAVKTPGVYQVEGRRTVFEVLSMAGGLDVSAGSTLKITRRLEYGRIPLPGATDDPTGQFSIATLKLKSILNASNPEENTAIKPHDVITVPRAEIVYVIGHVQKAGGFALNEQESITVLQALSLAGGLDREASASGAKILRAGAGKPQRDEIGVNVKAILDGRASDVPMRPEDILFIPSSAPKRAVARAAEAAIQIGTGIVIWRR
jgi:polysaccharide biosynthesis/export protein